MGSLNLPEEEKQKEFTLSCLIDRQSSSPSETNLSSVFNALKEAFIYMPARLVVSEKEKKRIEDNIKNGMPANPGGEVKIIPQLLINKQGLKVMPWFSRDEEIKNVDNGKGGIIRMPAVKALEIAENMTEAFDIVLDLFTHPVRLSIDDIIEGFANASSEKNKE